jgi:hypothetical protein
VIPVRKHALRIAHWTSIESAPGSRAAADNADPITKSINDLRPCPCQSSIDVRQSATTYASRRLPRVAARSGLRPARMRPTSRSSRRQITALTGSMSASMVALDCCSCNRRTEKRSTPGLGWPPIARRREHGRATAPASAFARLDAPSRTTEASRSRRSSRQRVGEDVFDEALRLVARGRGRDARYAFALIASAAGHIGVWR